MSALTSIDSAIDAAQLCLFECHLQVFIELFPNGAPMGAGLREVANQWFGFESARSDQTRKHMTYLKI